MDAQCIGFDTSNYTTSAAVFLSLIHISEPTRL